jgi:hypothetical protein
VAILISSFDDGGTTDVSEHDENESHDEDVDDDDDDEDVADDGRRGCVEYN